MCRQAVHYLYSLYKSARSSPLPAVREKYSHPKYLCIAKADPPPELPDALFFPVDVLWHAYTLVGGANCVHIHLNDRLSTSWFCLNNLARLYVQAIIRLTKTIHEYLHNTRLPIFVMLLIYDSWSWLLRYSCTVPVVKLPSCSTADHWLPGSCVEFYGHLCEEKR